MGKDFVQQEGQGQRCQILAGANVSGRSSVTAAAGTRGCSQPGPKGLRQTKFGGGLKPNLQRASPGSSCSCWAAGRRKSGAEGAEGRGQAWGGPREVLPVRRKTSELGIHPFPSRGTAILV